MFVIHYKSPNLKISLKLRPHVMTEIPMRRTTSLQSQTAVRRTAPPPGDLRVLGICPPCAHAAPLRQILLRRPVRQLQRLRAPCSESEIHPTVNNVVSRHLLIESQIQMVPPAAPHHRSAPAPHHHQNSAAVIQRPFDGLPHAALHPTLGMAWWYDTDGAGDPVSPESPPLGPLYSPV